MNRLNKLMLYLALLIFVLPVFSSGETIIKAGRTVSPPTIDGRLTDSCWQKAEPITNFILLGTTKPAEFQTIGYVLYDDKGIYIGMKCLEPDVSSIDTKTKKVFLDCIEIMLDPTLSRNKYFHFAVSATGLTYDAERVQTGFVEHEDWSGEWKTKTYIGKDYWSSEVAIPFYILDISHNVKSSWGINLCRKKHNPPELSTIVSTSGGFHTQGDYAVLKGVDVDFSKYCYSVGVPIISTEIKDKKLNVRIDIAVKNDTGKKQEIKLECWLIDPQKNPKIKSNVVDMPSEKEKIYPIGTFELENQGEYDCYISINDANTKRMFSLTKIKIPIEYVPIAINVIEPFYRDAIFETQNLKKVVLEVENNLDKEKLRNTVLDVEIRKNDASEAILKTSISNPKNITKAEFDCKRLPYGKLDIVAALKDKTGKILAQTKHPLQKLPYKKGEVWLDRDLNWHIDGKPFFPVGAWGTCESKYANVFMTSQILLSPLKTIICFYWSGTTKHRVAFDDYIKKFTKEKVAKFKDNPGLFAYWMADEPECLPIPQKSLEGLYRILREEDPYHPVLISNNSVQGGRTYANAADFNIPHPYPNISRKKRINDFAEIPIHMEDYLKYTNYKKQVGFMHQGFNYEDFGSADGRIPTYIELREQSLLAIICGAKSILQYNRMYLHYPELYIGIPHLTQELVYLCKAVLAPKSKLKVKVNSDKIRTLLKDVDGELYLFISNADMKPREVQITIQGINKFIKQLNVISEDRSVIIKDDSFVDEFDTFEVHVYTTSKKKTGLLSVKEICKKVDKINRARKKLGNLAFQMFEEDGVIINASSKAGGKYSRKDNSLWQVVDGIIDESDTYGNLTWQDTTPNKFPDWIEIKLPEKHNIGKVIVYPFGRSLKDYSIQAFVQGEWKEVYKVSEKNAEMITHTFKQLNTDRIRIWITATNGPNSKITEIEIYKK